MRHPNAPSHIDVKAARKAVGFTIEEAARLVFHSRDSWKGWERPPNNPKHRSMHPAIAELFALKSGLKPLPAILAKLADAHARVY